LLRRCIFLHHAEKFSSTTGGAYLAVMHINSLQRNKTIHIRYIDISRSKERAANYAGDGPSAEGVVSTTPAAPFNTPTIEQSNSLLTRNGIILIKNRSNANCTVQCINAEILSNRIPNNSLKVGDVIVEINGINIVGLNIAAINELLGSRPLQSILNYSKQDWNRLKNRNIFNSTIISGNRN